MKKQVDPEVFGMYAFAGIFVFTMMFVFGVILYETNGLEVLRNGIGNAFMWVLGG